MLWMDNKGHSYMNVNNEPVCGIDAPVKETNLYGKGCPECTDIVNKLLTGQQYAKYKANTGMK